MQFYSILSRALNRRPHIGLVGTVLVSVHQEFQESQGAQDPQDQLVLQDHPAIMGLKDPWEDEETKVMKVLVEGHRAVTLRYIGDATIQPSKRVF